MGATANDTSYGCGWIAIATPRGSSGEIQMVGIFGIFIDIDLNPDLNPIHLAAKLAVLRRVVVGD